MTVIAAIATDGNVIMGSDSAASADGLYVYKGEGKIAEITAGNGDRILIGAAGNAAILSLVKRELKIDATPDADASNEDADDWAGAVAQAVTEILSECTPSLVCTGNGDADNLDGLMAMAWRGHLWVVFTHSAMRPSNGVVGIGSGGGVAVGAMNAAMKFGAKPEDAVYEAVTLAAAYADGCGTDVRGPLMHSTVHTL